MDGVLTAICKIQLIVIASSSSQPLVITHCLSIECDCTWTVHVHGKQVFRNHCVPLESFPSTLVTSAANNLISLIDSLQVCTGNPDARYITMCHSRNDQIEAADGTVKAIEDNYYPVTVIYDNCENDILQIVIFWSEAQNVLPARSTDQFSVLFGVRTRSRELKVANHINCKSHQLSIPDHTTDEGTNV